MLQKLSAMSEIILNGIALTEKGKRFLSQDVTQKVNVGEVHIDGTEIGLDYTFNAIYGKWRTLLTNEVSRKGVGK